MLSQKLSPPDSQARPGLLPGSGGERKLTNYLYFGAIIKGNFFRGRGEHTAVHSPKQRSERIAGCLAPAHLDATLQTPLIFTLIGKLGWHKALGERFAAQ